MSTKFAPSDRQREVARITADVLQVDRPSVLRFYDELQEYRINVLVAPNSPETGVTTYATVGLSDHVMLRNGQDFNLRVELLGVCNSSITDFDNVLATLAFCVIKSKWFCAPGIIFPGAISM